MGAEQQYNSGGDGKKYDRVDHLLIDLSMSKSKAEMRLVALEFAVSAFLQGLETGIERGKKNAN